MRYRSCCIALLAGLALLPLCLRGQESAPEPRRIAVTAKKYEFQPNRIELKAGEPVEITFTSLDAKHGFTCKDLKLEKVVFDKENPVKVSFTPSKAGTFEFRCANFCGLGHSGMKGQFVVTE
jgi:cytochrome c oxidase subunit 2